MPDTGMFYLHTVRFSVDGDSPSPRRAIEFVRAQCNECRGIFRASTPPLLENINGGGVVLVCPSCSARQAISIARFEEFVARFPMGNLKGRRPLPIAQTSERV